MARRRNKKGRFVSGGKRKRRSRRRKRGMGSIITVRRGMGQLDMGDMLPALVGGGLAALTSLGIRWFVDYNAGTTQRMLFKWAPLFGLAVGGVGSLALFMTGGTPQAARGFLSAALVSAYGLGTDMLLKEKGGSILASGGYQPAALTNGNGVVTGPTIDVTGTAGVGAIVPEYSRPTGAVVMEQVGPGGTRAGTIGSYGETVSLSGVNVSAFGTPGFNA